MGSATGGLGETVRERGVFKLALLLRESFMNGDAFVESAHAIQSARSNASVWAAVRLSGEKLWPIWQLNLMSLPCLVS